MLCLSLSCISVFRPSLGTESTHELAMSGLSGSGASGCGRLTTAHGGSDDSGWWRLRQVSPTSLPGLARPWEPPWCQGWIWPHGHRSQDHFNLRHFLSAKGCKLTKEQETFIWMLWLVMTCPGGAALPWLRQAAARSVPGSGAPDTSEGRRRCQELWS